MYFLSIAYTAGKSFSSTLDVGAFDNLNKRREEISILIQRNKSCADFIHTRRTEREKEGKGVGIEIEIIFILSRVSECFTLSIVYEWIYVYWHCYSYFSFYFYFSLLSFRFFYCSYLVLQLVIMCRECKGFLIKGLLKKTFFLFLTYKNCEIFVFERNSETNRPR